MPTSTVVFIPVPEGGDRVRRVDVNVPRFNQAVVAALSGIAFVVQIEWLVAATLVLLAAGAAGGPRLAPLSRLYVSVIRPRLAGDRAVVTEPAAPPRFAQVVGTSVLAGATFALAAGADAVGWAATLLVTSLASLAVLADVCVGCLIYERAVRR
jgi:hypothetical protein